MGHHLSQEEYKKSVRDVYKTMGILSLVTIVEVAGALFYEFVLMADYGFPRIYLNIFVILASLVKAYWIMAVFMHVNHEKKGFAFTILFPFTFLIWAVLAFCIDGAYWAALGESINSVLF